MGIPEVAPRMTASWALLYVAAGLMLSALFIFLSVPWVGPIAGVALGALGWLAIWLESREVADGQED